MKRFSNASRIILLMAVMLFTSLTANASLKAGTATVYVGSTTSIELASTYQRTLKNATSVTYYWKSGNTSYVTISSSTKYGATIKGVKSTGTSTCKVYFYASYYLDGYYRTMDFYYDVTVLESTVYVTSVTLNKSSETLTVGETLQLSATVLPTTATDRSVTWLTSNSTVASVDSSGLVKAMLSGTATITCKANDGSGKYATCKITVTEFLEGEDSDDSDDATTDNNYEAVDLGLSVKWATCNIGASSPEDYGNYYAWGEIETKEDYSKSTSVTYEVEMDDISGNAEYDAATANWGSSWRMPTDDEMIELINNCTWIWTALNDINGYLVTGSNGNSIFLPAAGARSGTSLNYTGSAGHYHSSMSSPTSTNYGTWTLVFTNSNIDVVECYRYTGFTVRPVIDYEEEEGSTDDDVSYFTSDGIPNALIVHSNDGSSVAYILGEYPKVSYSNSDILITSAGIDVSYPISDIMKLTYEHVDVSSSIDAISTNETSFSYDGGPIVLSGLSGNSLLQVYTIGGILTHSEKISTSSYTYPLSDLPTGIYIINVNGKTFKISKK